MIEAANVCYWVGASVILDEVGLSIAPGVVTAILGPNGAGKIHPAQMSDRARCNRMPVASCWRVRR